jgi:hypothetical protein
MGQENTLLLMSDILMKKYIPKSIAPEERNINKKIHVRKVLRSRGAIY